METTTETTTTKKAKAIQEKAVEVYRNELATGAKKTLDESIQEAFAMGKFEGLSRVESETLIHALAAIAMCEGALDPAVERIHRTQHFDVTNWRYHADVLYRGAATIAVGAGAFMAMSYLTRRGTKVEGAIGGSNEDAGPNPFSDTTPAYEASARPSKRAMN